MLHTLFALPKVTVRVCTSKKKKCGKGEIIIIHLKKSVKCLDARTFCVSHSFISIGPFFTPRTPDGDSEGDRKKREGPVSRRESKRRGEGKEQEKHGEAE